MRHNFSIPQRWPYILPKPGWGMVLLLTRNTLSLGKRLFPKSDVHGFRDRVVEEPFVRRCNILFVVVMVVLSWFAQQDHHIGGRLLCGTCVYPLTYILLALYGSQNSDLDPGG